MAEPQTEFRRRLQQARRSKQLSQRQVGELLGVSGSAIGEWERGLSYPTRRNALALERHLDQTPGTLTRLLGYDPEDSDGVIERLAAVEAVLVELRAEIASLVAARRS